MKNIISILVVFMAVTSTSCAQDIKLPAPQQNRNSMQVAEALATRHSSREFSEKELTIQDLSDVCWAACGQSRDDEHITAPTAMNKQEITLYVFTRKGAYEYLPKENILKFVAAGDNRGIVAGTESFRQDFVLQAPVSLVMVMDFDKFGSNGDHAMKMACVDAGNVSENINLFCQAIGLVTVPRATMDVEGIRELLGLPESHLPILNNPVGYPKN